MDETLALSILAVIAIIFAVPYALAALLYTFPVFAFWLLIPLRTGTEPALTIDPSSHPQLAKLRADKRAAEQRYDEIRYSDCGVRWSDNLGRFEERSIRGRELNEQLEHWAAETDRIKAEIKEIEFPTTTLVWEWRKNLLAWSKLQSAKEAKRTGWKTALLFFAGVWVATELAGVAFPNLVTLLAFAWNPDPDLLHPGIAIGAAAGWAAGIYRVLHPSNSFVKRAQAKFQEYENAAELRERAEDFEIEQVLSEDAAEEDYETSDKGSSQNELEDEELWYEILGVSPNATHDEINGAYRTRIKQYHPDRVTGLGEKLQYLAKAETQKLNAAREEGLSLPR